MKVVTIYASVINMFSKINNIRFVFQQRVFIMKLNHYCAMATKVGMLFSNSFENTFKFRKLFKSFHSVSIIYKVTVMISYAFLHGWRLQC